MRAAIYNPYLDSLGGGERYSISFAKALSEMGYEIFLEWSDKEILKKLQERFGIDCSPFRVVEDIKRGDGYDLCFWVSDGSIPSLKSRRNFLHFQIPFQNVNGKSLLNKMKLWRIEKVICNSNFTKSVIDKEFGVDSYVLYPPFDSIKIKSKRKENIILYVGRFSELKQSKRQDLLIKIFKKFLLKTNGDWNLILAGGTEVGSENYIKYLERETNSKNVQILKSPSYKTLIDLYGKSKFFWSAAGFDVNSDKNPELVEHFGISLVEAMSAGAVPLVYKAGGYKEIIKDNKNGILWEKESELINKTIELIKNKELYKKLSLEAKLDSQNFSYAKFKENISKFL